MTSIEKLKEEVEALVVDVLYWREKCLSLRLHHVSYKFWARHNSQTEEALIQDIAALKNDIAYCSSMWNREKEAVAYKAEASKYKDLFTDVGWKQMCENDTELDRLTYWKSIAEEAKEITLRMSARKI